MCRQPSRSQLQRAAPHLQEPTSHGAGQTNSLPRSSQEGPPKWTDRIPRRLRTAQRHRTAEYKECSSQDTELGASDLAMPKLSPREPPRNDSKHSSRIVPSVKPWFSFPPWWNQKSTVSSK